MAPKRKTPTTSVESASGMRTTRSSSRPATRSAVAASSTPLIALQENQKKKKSKKSSEKSKVEEAHQETSESGVEEAPDETTDSAVVAKTIIIEHCKQCNSFKVRATKVKEGLKKAVRGIKVELNPEKPRMGCFVIREAGGDGEPFVNLLDMKRPFAAMKALDMDQVVSEIVEKIK